ncbi:hypothetical protein PIB30_101907 [Stylosanthes scabra]|uniref:Uncharacterized protein n=1 Tax=Stylosanthes scabra TaxID=79078 RepID=A0ABU6ZW49_9FABA|nr:hypothetical protein [Stylosanthes scabra]
MKLPLAKTKDKTPSPTPSDFDRQQTRGKVIALESRKRSTRGHSRGLSPNKALRIGGTSQTPATTRVLRMVRTPFSNRESSPIDTDEENEEGQEVPLQAPLTSPALEAPSPTEHAHSKPQEQDLNLLLSQAKQVYSSGGKVPLGGGISSKETAEPEAVRSITSASATLSRIAAKIISLLAFPLEDLATNDKLKVELIVAISILDDELPVSEALFLRSSSFGRPEKRVGCRCRWLEITVSKGSRMFRSHFADLHVLKQGRKSEQKAVARIKALEEELAAVKDGLANIKSANDGLSDKLKCYEGNKAFLTSAVSKAESDMGKARASYNAAEKKVEAFDKHCAHLKLSLGCFI